MRRETGADVFVQTIGEVMKLFEKLIDPVVRFRYSFRSLNNVYNSAEYCRGGRKRGEANCAGSKFLERCERLTMDLSLPVRLLCFFRKAVKC